MPYRICLLLTISIFSCLQLHAQCSPQNGPPPSNLYFNTASNGSGQRLPAGSKDTHWQYSVDSVNGPYMPAIVMDSLPPDYYVSTWPDCNWISISANGIHSGNHNFFYKFDFDLPCNTQCGKSYDEAGAFCLSLDIFCDNSVLEIYDNGAPQGGYLGGIIPVNDPYHAVQESVAGKITVSLCNNWHAGKNSLIIEVASSAPETGVLIQASTTFPNNVSTYIIDSICSGETYQFGTQPIATAGRYTQTVTTASGCDSTVLLNLSLKPSAQTIIDTSICEGDSYLGHTTTGSYSDTFNAVNGCDSIRTINLNVVQSPQPDLGMALTICTGATLSISPGSFLTYLWQDGSSQDHLIVNKAGLYSVTVTNACGTASAYTTVTEKPCYILFPSAFTPNKDGLNDYFKIISGFQFEAFDLIVYNRWGQKIFESKDASQGWDGNINGKPAAPATYIYTCMYKKDGTTSTQKGTVVLIR